MMIVMKYLFKPLYLDGVSHEIAMRYFNLMYHDGLFLQVVRNIVNRQDSIRDGCYCYFPDWNGPDEDGQGYFFGVRFEVGYPPTEDDRLTVTEQECAQLVMLACQKYLEKHPEDKEEVDTLLKELKDGFGISSDA